jgi:hypothetical protein
VEKPDDIPSLEPFDSYLIDEEKSPDVHLLSVQPSSPYFKELQHSIKIAMTQQESDQTIKITFWAIDCAKILNDEQIRFGAKNHFNVLIDKLLKEQERHRQSTQSNTNNNSNN